MNRRHDLVRDLAKLFVKYNLQDWRVILDALSHGGPELGLLRENIEALAKSGKVRARRRASPRTNAALKALEGEDPQRHKILTAIYEKLKSKEILSTMPEIREYCSKVGIKDKISGGREAAIKLIIIHLSLAELDKIEDIFSYQAKPDRDLLDEYRNWFDMIYSKKGRLDKPQ